jgi:formamidopyrimidine-DNA glycosylase
VPELPEVETVRRQLEPALAGRVLAEVEILDHRLVQPRDCVEVAAELRGERVVTVGRRGKYLLVRFASRRVLVVHLRMTGAFLTGEAAGGGGALGVGGAGGAGGAVPHLRALLTLDDGLRVAYRDVRRFGTWTLLEPGDLQPYLAVRLGPEPLGTFSAADLAGRLARRQAPVKAVILDQLTVAGVGNIYADEALWHSRIHPLRPAASLAAGEVRSLHRAIRATLRKGIARQGATLRDYRAPDGSSGGMQDEFKVYGRDGEPCPRCGREIAKIRVAGRGTHFCPRCQRP